MSLSAPEAAHWYFSFARFDNRPPRKADPLKLARMNEILAYLDNPHETYPSILIAGTKGKGSTAALIESMLRAAGYRTGLFTSPHLHSFRERVRVNGQDISAAQLIAITERLQDIQTHFEISTFFEWITALAFEHFAREQVEIAVVEVGLGGRLDCTNVLTPRVSVITPISYDHMEILGNTLTEIAFEKAGIIKPKRPVVVAPQELPAFEEIQRRANQLESRIVDVEKLWQWELVETTPTHQVVRLRHVRNARWRTYTLPLLGPHQRVNLATAMATMDALNWRKRALSPQSLQQGIASVKWHARFEILARAPYIVADGAHNRASAHELVRTLDEVLDGARVHFIFGVSSDKDIAGILAELAPRAASFVFTRAHNARASAPEALSRLAAVYNVPMHSAQDAAHALELARGIAANDDVICVTGSLFIAAEAREIILRAQNIPVEKDA